MRSGSSDRQESATIHKHREWRGKLKAISEWPLQGLRIPCCVQATPTFTLTKSYRGILKKFHCHSGRGTGVCNKGKILESSFLSSLPNKSRLSLPSSPLPVRLRIGEQGGRAATRLGLRETRRGGCTAGGSGRGRGRKRGGEKSSSKSGPATRVGGEGEVARRKSRPDSVFQTGFGVSKLEGASKPVRYFCKESYENTEGDPTKSIQYGFPVVVSKTIGIENEAVVPPCSRIPDPDSPYALPPVTKPPHFSAWKKRGWMEQAQVERRGRQEEKKGREENWGKKKF